MELKNLLIVKIPRNKKAITTVLDIVADTAWDTKYVKDWLADESASGIKLDIDGRAVFHYKTSSILGSTLTHEQFVYKYINNKRNSK